MEFGLSAKEDSDPEMPRTVGAPVNFLLLPGPLRMAIFRLLGKWDFFQEQQSEAIRSLRSFRLEAMNVSCPHCSATTEIAFQSVEEILCRNCGASLRNYARTACQTDHDRSGAAAAASTELTVQQAVVIGEDITASYLVTTGENEIQPLLTETGYAELQTAFAPGRALQDRYVLQRELGRGGMGQVYLGRDTRLDRAVAIKVMLPALDGRRAQPSTETRERQREAFVQEARLGANLLHPAIATVFDFGFHEGKPFTVFEYIEGETLSDLLRRRKNLPLDEVRLILTSLAQALDFAHAHHVVHRDLKPANIRATAQGQFKILDLGLAKEFRRQVDWTKFAGTPAYASPEQSAGLPSDGRTDQYALGLIAFEMLTGQRPFRSSDPWELLRMQREQEPPSPQSIMPALPESLSTALLRALRKNPNDRFATCEEFAVAMGCQFLSASRQLPEVLLVADVRIAWQNFWSNKTQRSHLVLTVDALWCDHCDHAAEISRWPFVAIKEIKRQRLSRDLTLTVQSADGVLRRRIRFRKRRECRDWFERLNALLAISRSGSAKTKTELGAVGKTVILLRQRPNARFQLLGPVETTGHKSWSAEAGLRIRGAMLGADAVIEVQKERLPGFRRTIRRLSGTAVQTVDNVGLIEVATRAFNEQVARWSRPSLWLLGAFTILGLISIARQLIPGAGPNKAKDLVQGVRVLLIFGWPLILFAVLRVSLMPTLVPACALALLALIAQTLSTALGTLFYGMWTGQWVPALTGVLMVFLNPVSLAVMPFQWFLASRLWQTYRTFRSILPAEERRAPPLRRYSGYAATALSVLFVILLVVNGVLGGFINAREGWLPSSKPRERKNVAVPAAENAAIGYATRQDRR